jgi:predicted PurR-regulated permease PerM
VPFLSSLDIAAVLQTMLERLGSHAGGFVAGAADTILKMAVSIIALFYLLKDGREFLYGFIQLSPLSDEEDVQIIHKLKAVSYSLIRGTLVIAILQGFMTGIGFVLFGVPNPVLWGSTAAIGALLPMVGTGVVAVPAVVYLIVTGHYAAAIGLAAWSMLIVGLVDNIIGPKLIGSGARIHPLFILLSVLGGLIMFGVAGFLIGPLLFGLLVALWEIYKVKIKEIHQRSLSASRGH